MGWFSKTLAALALGLALTSGGPAAAGEARDLSREASHVMFSALPMDALVAQFTNDGNFAKAFPSHPEWVGMFGEALAEEFKASMPRVEDILARRLEEGFTLEELRAGAPLFRGEAGRAMGALVAAGARGEKNPPTPPELEAVIDQVGKTKEGKSYLRKFARIDRYLASFVDDFVSVMVPGTFRRFGEKAEAAEKAREAAGG